MISRQNFERACSRDSSELAGGAGVVKGYGLFTLLLATVLVVLF